MRDIPVFTTENGVASLVLEEIPYKACAYIRVHDSSSPLDFLRECADFCVAVGARHIYATGKGADHYPLHNSILIMRREMDGLPDTDAKLCIVTDSTMELWRNIYNEKMADVDNAATMTIHKARIALQKEKAYLVYSGETLLGIGLVSGDTICALASVVSGSGADVLLALSRAVVSEVVSVEVSSTNARALRLYKKLGFVEDNRISEWYQII